MAQRFVLKNRSKNADGHKEMSHMIRDPRQRVSSAQYDAKTKKTTKGRLVKIDPKKKNLKQVVSLDDRGVKSRIMRKSAKSSLAKRLAASSTSRSRKLASLSSSKKLASLSTVRSKTR